MSSTVKNILIVVGVLLLIGIFFISPYNTMVSKDETVKKYWNNVETQYQRRYELIPNLINTVKGVANFERGVLEAVTQARSSVGSMKIDPNNLTPENIQKFEAAQSQMSSALSRLLVVSEQYPQLRATESFRDLQAQLEGTENRIGKARDDFNGSIQEYNTYIRKFPNNITAGLFGFAQKEGFKSEKGAEKAPKVQF
ncbi:MAG: LemA family protein [Saprospiraceae bacterium]|jgi:LemA protein|nr:LemA family protein [Saprospiraceae bacterium]